MAWLLGGIVGAVAAFALGMLWRARLGTRSLSSAEARATTLLEQATREADAAKRAAVLEGREEALRAKQQVERELQEARSGQLAAERAFHDKEGAFNRRIEIVEKKERDLKRAETELHEREDTVVARAGQLDQLLAEHTARLEKMAGMSSEDARQQLIARIEDEARGEAARHVTTMREQAQREAEREARKITLLAIQRYAADHVADATVSVVHLPSDDMKGRIIGREGRNIRAFEVVSGVDVIIDDTPEAVVLSAFDPVRREIARVAMQRLVEDGRIHPARIEEVVAKVRVEVEAQIRELGERACLDLGLHGIHAELMNLLGRLRWRTSFGQNILEHSKEVAWFAGMLAAELGLDTKMARRAGLMHDIGKAIDHDREGTHPQLGMEVAQRYGEPQPVLEAIGYHHDDYAGGSLWPVLVSAADAMSGARPGARRESVEVYIKRLEALERIANQFPGVEKSYAIQAGREIRILVEHARVDDARAQGLANDVARRIEKELEYPGQIRVTVIRETRATDFAK